MVKPRQERVRARVATELDALAGPVADLVGAHEPVRFEPRHFVPCVPLSEAPSYDIDRSCEALFGE
jgi:hypothetical protein